MFQKIAHFSRLPRHHFTRILNARRAASHRFNKYTNAPWRRGAARRGVARRGARGDDAARFRRIRKYSDRLRSVWKTVPSYLYLYTSMRSRLTMSRVESPVRRKRDR